MVGGRHRIYPEADTCYGQRCRIGDKTCPHRKTRSSGDRSCIHGPRFVVRRLFHARPWHLGFFACPDHSPAGLGWGNSKNQREALINSNAAIGGWDTCSLVRKSPGELGGRAGPEVRRAGKTVSNTLVSRSRGIGDERGNEAASEPSFDGLAHLSAG